MDYHVDCRSGDDGRDGRSPAAAWRTVSKVSATTFQPGDAILLQRGTRCAGTLCNPYGIHISGSRGTLRHLHVRDVVAHGVGDEVKSKASGLLVGPDGQVLRRGEGFADPADLGLTLRALIGSPAGSPTLELPRDDAFAGAKPAIPPCRCLRQRRPATIH